MFAIIISFIMIIRFELTGIHTWLSLLVFVCFFNIFLNFSFQNHRDKVRFRLQVRTRVISKLSPVTLSLFLLGFISQSAYIFLAPGLCQAVKKQTTIPASEGA